MKILFVATVQSHIAQFHMGAIAMLKEQGYVIDVAARNNLPEKNGLALHNVTRVFDIPFDRSPSSIRNVEAYKRLKKVIADGNYDVIHCNTPVGGILTRLAARKERRKGCCVIYTAHGFHFYSGAPIKNWIVFYTIEKAMSRITDKLIVINDEDFGLASKKFSCPVFHIHGVGIKKEKYDAVSIEDAAAFRAKHGWKDDFLIVCTGELNSNKNQATIITAMNQVLTRVPNARLLLAGNGPNEKKLRQLISERKLEDRVTLLGYRVDLEWFVHACDLVVSASIREGLGMNVIEAMYCRKAVIASLNRGHRELIKNGESGYLVAADNAGDFAKYIIELAENKEKRDLFGEAGFGKALKYTDENVKNELRRIYELTEMK